MHIITLHILWTIIQIIIAAGFWLPVLLWGCGLFKRRGVQDINQSGAPEPDYGIIVTAYQQTDLIPHVIRSIEEMNYNCYIIYVVADNCDVSKLHFTNEKVKILRPQTVLASNIKSHIYAMDHFVRNHDMLTIIDSDNLVHPEYLNELNCFFRNGYQAVQGVRAARNLNTIYACLDEAGDMYYRFVDRKLLFDAGSSATLAGSGMAFKHALYRSALANIHISGAGFDKILQYELVNKGYQLAFAEKAIVYDGKTSRSDQLVKQRARWISAWAKSWLLGWKLFFTGMLTLNWNKFAFANVLIRPPLFILFFLSFACVIIDIFYQPRMLWFWLAGFIMFLAIILTALLYFKAGKNIFLALLQVPKFIFYQIKALFKAKKANEISVATKHEITPENKNI